MSGRPLRVSSVPQALDGLRPVRRLLHLVDHEKRPPGAGIAGLEARRLPLLRDPSRPPQGWLVGAAEAVGQPGLAGDLGDQGRLADLPGAGDDLEESPRLLEAPEEVLGLGADI